MRAIPATLLLLLTSCSAVQEREALCDAYYPTISRLVEMSYNDQLTDAERNFVNARRVEWRTACLFDAPVSQVREIATPLINLGNRDDPSPYLDHVDR